MWNVGGKMKLDIMKGCGNWFESGRDGKTVSGSDE